MSRVKRLTVVLLLNLSLITALVIVGLAAHSLAVLAAGADYLADAGAIGVSLLAIWLASRPPSRARPHGYPNATNIAALINAGWLLMLNIAIATAAIQRLAEGTRPVEGLPVLIVSGIAAAVMLAGALVLRGDPDGENDDGEEDLNVTAVLLDTAADAAAAAGVAVSGAVILGASGWYWLDPAVALLIAVIIGYHAQKLVRKVELQASFTAARPLTGAGGQCVRAAGANSRQVASSWRHPANSRSTWTAVGGIRSPACCRPRGRFISSIGHSTIRPVIWWISAL
jgi:cobalt-zinc-cadmium efflux system protein